MEKLAYIILGLGALSLLGAIYMGFVPLYPMGLIGILGIGQTVLIVKVLADRIRNREDTYYDKNVNQ